MVTKRYQIGEFRFELLLPGDLVVPANMELFRIKENDEEDAAVDVCYKFSIVEDLDKHIEILEKQKDKRREVNRSDFRLIYIEGRECRLLGIKGRPEFYGISRALDDRNVEVCIRSSYEEWTGQDTIFASFLMLEKFMMERDAYILHSSYIEADGMAILFSAPSETGKSTQASLWEQYCGARVINGDRSLLYKKDGQWYAAGWPVCGDSHICINETYPIRSIVMLKQARENKVYPMRPMQAFQEMLSQITVNSWNRVFQEHAMNALENLITEVFVYGQECDISREAVETLRSKIL